MTCYISHLKSAKFESLAAIMMFVEIILGSGVSLLDQGRVGVAARLALVNTLHPSATTTAKVEQRCKSAIGVPLSFTDMGSAVKE